MWLKTKRSAVFLGIAAALIFTGCGSRDEERGGTENSQMDEEVVALGSKPLHEKDRLRRCRINVFLEDRKSVV